MQQVREKGRLSLTSADLSLDLELVPHDVRAANYRAEEFGSSRVARPLDIGLVRTFKGRARQTQNGKPLAQSGDARFTINEERIEGLIITGTEHYFVEPAQKFSSAAATTDYAIYKEDDVVVSTNMNCGVTLSEQVNERTESVLRDNASALAAATTTLPFLSLQIATEADHEYVLLKGGPAAAAQEILSIMNQVDGLFENQLGLTLRVS